MSLRDYQVESINKIRESFSQGNKKALLVLPTGAGKTMVFCTMIKEAYKKGKKAVVITRGRKIVDQASQRLFREHVPHGVMMAGHAMYKPRLPVQVCSIDTLRARNIVPECDLLIIDEAHFFTSDGDKEFLSRFNCFIVAVTATPYVDSGLRHLADIMVKPTSMLSLIKNNYLVPFKYYAPSEPDVSEVKISKSTGDFVNDALAEAMSSNALTGKIVDNWLEIAKDLPTILFAVNINHSKMLAERFRQAGVAAEHCDADTPDEERTNVIKRLESGVTKIICNVGIFSTGSDIPSLRAIVMARPTTSLNLYIQQAGRGTRLSEGKEYCILLDHAGNIKRHGLPTDEPDVDLDGNEAPSDKRSKTCKECFAIFRGTTTCPECGYKQTKEELEREAVEIQETEAKLKELQIEIDPIKRAYKELLKEAKQKNRKPMWASYKLIDRFGLERARPYLTEAFVDRLENKNASLFSNSRFKGVGGK